MQDATRNEDTAAKEKRASKNRSFLKSFVENTSESSLELRAEARLLMGLYLTPPPVVRNVAIRFILSSEYSTPDVFPSVHVCIGHYCTGAWSWTSTILLINPLLPDCSEVQLYCCVTLGCYIGIWLPICLQRPQLCLATTQLWTTFLVHIWSVTC